MDYGFGVLILLLSVIVICSGLLIMEFIGVKFFNMNEEVEEEEDDDNYIYYREI